MFVSDYLQLNEEQFDHFVEMGVFDALLDKDSNFFINVIRLKKSTIAPTCWILFLKQSARISYVTYLMASLVISHADKKNRGKNNS